jgi:hypothetical protein
MRFLFVLVAGITCWGLGVSSLHAEDGFVSLTGITTQVQLAPFMTRAFSEGASMSTFVNAMFLAAVGIGAMLAVLQLTRAGLLYMGSDAWGKKDKAKHLMQDAVLGLLLLLAIVLILDQINPQLRNLDVLNKIDGSLIQGTSGAGARDTSGIDVCFPNVDGQNCQ